MPAEKRNPDLSPPKVGPLAGKLEEAVANEAAANEIAVTLRVGGGLRGQEYHYEFSTTGGARVRCRLRDAMKRREMERESATLQKNDFKRLLRQIQASKILTRPEEPPRFLPDTVVGVLEISDGQTTQRIWFAADEDQAEVQNKKMPPGVAKIVEMIYAMGARILKTRSIIP